MNEGKIQVVNGQNKGEWIDAEQVERCGGIIHLPIKGNDAKPWLTAGVESFKSSPDCVAYRAEWQQEATDANPQAGRWVLASLY